MEPGQKDGQGESARTIRLRDALTRNRLRVGSGPDMIPVVAVHDTGFSIDAMKAAHLRGCVSLFNGRAQIGEGLIVPHSRDGDLIRFEFKRWTDAADGPARDYAPDGEA